MGHRSGGALVTLAAGDVISAHESTATELFDGDEFTVIVYESRVGAVHRLEAGAAAAWLAIDGVSSIGQIVAELAETFGEPTEVIAPVVTEAMERFWAAGLLAGSRAIEDPEVASRLDYVLPRPPDP